MKTTLRCRLFGHRWFYVPLGYGIYRVCTRGNCEAS